MSFTLSGTRVLVTGGTGSFGIVAVDRFLAAGAREVVVYSRDEYKQSTLARRHAGDGRVRFVLGDVRDGARLEEALAGIDVVVHAAAMKQVPACEENPGEAVLTNVVGAVNVVRASRRAGVARAVNLSADKATVATSVYGATKLLSERIFADGGAGPGGTFRAASVRYSNVLGSRGSVTETYAERLRTGRPLVVFDARMVRLFLTQDEVVDLVVYALDRMVGGEIFVKDAPALRIVDLARAMVHVHGGGEVAVLDQARAGEAYDAWALSAAEAARALLTAEGYYVIPPIVAGVSREAYLARHPEARAVAPRDHGSPTARVLTPEEAVELVKKLRLAEVAAER